MTAEGRCFCEPCETRTKETYYLDGVCSNCGVAEGIVFRKGDQARPVTCPSCGVHRALRPIRRVS